jgi:hypothetical protein
MDKMNPAWPELASEGLADDTQAGLGGGERGKRRKDADAPVKMIVPRPRCSMTRAISRPKMKAPRQPTRHMASKSALCVSSGGAHIALPAL